MFPAAFRWCFAGVLPIFALCLSASAQEQRSRHNRPLPPTANVLVTVEKGFNSKPFPNASVIFRSTRDGHMNGNLETKTDPDGRASLDLLEVGSHITVQVLARGFATYAADFDLTADGKQILVKLQRPRTQVSQYGDGEDRPADVRPGTQEHLVPKTAPTTATPTPASPTRPLQTTPPADTPATNPATTPPATSPAAPPAGLL